MSYKVVVTGGRNYADDQFVYDRLSRLLADHNNLEVWHGGAKGADEFAEEFAHNLQLDSRTFAARWATQGKAAGPIRNQRMIDAKPDLVVAFPGGVGTADCVRKALAAGIPVLDLRDP